MPSRSDASRRLLPGSPFTAPAVAPRPPQDFQVGDRVSHDRHGLGRVVALEEASVLVDFGGGTVQRFAVDNAKITLL